MTVENRLAPAAARPATGRRLESLQAREVLAEPVASLAAEYAPPEPLHAPLLRH